MGTKRRILSATAGLAAITALEGLACGNPVAPRCPGHASCLPMPDAELQPHDAPPADAGMIDAGVAPVDEP